MKKILAIDTTLGACSAAIVVDDQVVARNKELRARGHVERLLPMIEDVRLQAEIVLSELDFIAVTVGPGTFAGVRVGLSAAKALGLALDKPLIPITSIEALVYEFCCNNTDFEGHLTVSIDARRNEFYMQDFNITGGMFEPINNPQAQAFDVAAKHLEENTVTIIGSGAKLLLDSTGHELGNFQSPNAEYVGKLGFKKISDAVSCHDISPLYLRAPDAIKPAPLNIVVTDD